MVMRCQLHGINILLLYFPFACLAALIIHLYKKYILYHTRDTLITTSLFHTVRSWRFLPLHLKQDVYPKWT